MKPMCPLRPRGYERLLLTVPSMLCAENGAELHEKRASIF